MRTDVAADEPDRPAWERRPAGCQDPLAAAFSPFGGDPFLVALLPPRQRAAVGEAQQRRHGFAVLALEEAWRRVARQPGIDVVEALRSHFEALAQRYRETLPPREREDLRARYLGLLAMAYVLRFRRREPIHPARWCSDLTLAEDAIQQARLTLADGTGRGTVRAAVLEAEALVAGVRKQNGRACAVLAEAAELLRGEQPPEWRAELLYWRGKLMAASRLRGEGEAVAVLREALATLDGVESPTEPVLRLAVIHHLTLAETAEQLVGDDAGALARAAARLRGAEALYEWFSTQIMRGQRAVMEGRILLLTGDLGGAQAAFAAANAVFAAQDATLEAARLLADVLLACRHARLPAELGPTFYRGTWQFPAQREVGMGGGVPPCHKGGSRGDQTEFFDRVVDVLVDRLMWRLPLDCHARVMPFVAEVRAAEPGAGGQWTAGEVRARRWQLERFRARVRWQSRPTAAGNDG